MKVALFGATGKTGRYLVPALIAAGHRVVAFGRNRDRLAVRCPGAEACIVDLERPAELDLSAVDAIVSLAHGRFIPAILPAVPATCRRVVMTGSTRIFSSLDDPAADAVRDGLAQLESWGRPAAMLHPSMIYGAPEDRNVNRIIRLIECWPRWLPIWLPLPGGGRHSVQPIYYKDAVAAFVAALELAPAAVEEIVLAGPSPIRYRDLIGAIADAMDRRSHPIGVPTGMLTAAATVAGKIGIDLPVDAAELRRMTEDKSFSVAALRDRLGIVPRDLAAGLADMKTVRGGSLVSTPRSGDHGR